MSQRPPPPKASIADAMGDGRLCAPSALRNIDPILELLAQQAPAAGRALEIASGTGQHMARFAGAFPTLDWQPSEVDTARHASITAWVGELSNVHPVIALDATAPGWATVHQGYDLILTINLLHLISAAEAHVLLDEAARALASGGRLILYGPFLRAGGFTSEGDARFHASLIEADPEIGYKNDRDVIERLQAAGLTLIAAVEMPANNLALVAAVRDTGLTIP